MKTFELAKKAVARLEEVAVTQEQFDSWPSTKKRQWLNDHPTSKFGKKTSPKKTNVNLVKPSSKNDFSAPKAEPAPMLSEKEKKLLSILKSKKKTIVEKLRKAHKAEAPDRIIDRYEQALDEIENQIEELE